ncbi:MAG: M48 family metallopeptidase [Cellulosilyticaceae bacterium]
MMYKLLRQKRKTISIGVDEQLQIIVKAPPYVSKKDIDEFVASHEDWIQKTKQIKEHEKAYKDWWYTRKLYFLGDQKQIRIIKGCREKIWIEDQNIMISLEDVNNQERARKLLEKWLIEGVRQYMTEISDKYCKLLGCHYNKIYIRKQRTRWGSCSSKQNLSYNSRLICAPLKCMEYVGLHEVMHLRHFNHSKGFWEDIKQIMPDYKAYQNILQRQSIYYNF